MTRFDAATPAERRKLFVEAITAHRERSSPYLTVETDGGATAERARAAGDDGGDPPGRDGSGGGDDGAGGEDDGIEVPGSGDAPFAVEESTGEDDGPDAPPLWVQFGDGVVNLDCTEAELDRLKDLLPDYPAFRIDDLTRPEDAEGVNVRISARADPNRTAEFLDELFLSVFDRPEEYRAWVVEV